MVQPTPFGRLLKRLRVEADLSQVELGQRSGLSPNAIGALERGERRHPQPHTKRRLAVALGLAEDGWARLLAADAGSIEADAHTGPGSSEIPRVATGAERAAAWELYVELVTRVAVADLDPDRGMLREALDSLYSLFGTTREILKRHGPDLAAANGESRFLNLATTILNRVLRPVLAEWHPLLLDHESRRPAGTSAVEHERSWSRNHEIRLVLAETRATLGVHARQLAAYARAS
jgi:transcriptional regulator with XRE-family HTH domain